MLSSLSAPQAKPAGPDGGYAQGAVSPVVQDAGRAPASSLRALVIASVVALGVLLAISIIVLMKLSQSGTSTPALLATPQVLTPIAATPQATLAFSPLAGAPLVQLQAYGSGMLLQPQDALRMNNGEIAIADTGHHRVVLLDSAGKLLRAVTQGASGPLRSPFSLALMRGNQLLVLDSDAGQIDQYTAGGALVASSDLALHLGNARAIAEGATGEVLVADPAMNAVLTLMTNFNFVRLEQGESGTGDTPFNQPSAVASAPDGSIYVVDSQSSRLVHYSASWTLLQQWPIVVPDTVHSARVIVLADGRLLASDPAHNALLLYDPSMAQPQSFPLPNGGEPLGIALGGHGDVLVTCSGTGEVLDVTVPGLKL
jgi:sugar lactone lactonase YvrE